MKFYRQRLTTIDLVLLRAHAARSGWLIETTDALRAGFGAPIIARTLPDGLNGDSTQLNLFAHSEVVGDAAPTNVGPVAFVAVPFDRDGEIRVWVPAHVVTIIDETIWLTSVDADPSVALELIADESIDTLGDEYEVSATAYHPTPDGYARAVATAVGEMRSGQLEKVVLARRVEGETTAPIDPAVVASRLHEREPACTLYALPALGEGRFVGASPELLVASSDGSIAAHPLAGTVALAEDTDSVQYGQWLMGSNKNLFEHRVVVDDIVARLSTRCTDVRADAKPSIVTLRSVAHLGTWIYGKIDERSPATALELLGLLHPTAAVGGIPQGEALAVIELLEPEDRGLYAGSVGWFDADDNGEWWLAIRGVTLSNNQFLAWAGAGIVADSDPIAEREETRDKLASILIGLGPRASH